MEIKIKNVDGIQQLDDGINLKDLLFHIDGDKELYINIKPPQGAHTTLILDEKKALAFKNAIDFFLKSNAFEDRVD